MNIRSLVGCRTFELAQGHQLRCATSSEVKVIKENLERLVKGPLNHHRSFWERQLPRQLTEEIAPESEWRYFVIAFKGTNVTLSKLLAACDLSPVELEVGFTMMSDGEVHGGVFWNAGRLFNVLEAAWWRKDFFVDVSTQDLEEIAAIHTTLGHHDSEVIDLGPLSRRLSELKGLPHGSPLRFLGYFAVLESLLTHAPNPTDPYDSITRQVKKKVALLDHRWSKAIDYRPFGGTAADKIWSTMYDYRSKLAHGHAPDFTGAFKSLGDHEQALRLIKETVKAVIRHALSEPQLVIDLRNC